MSKLRRLLAMLLAVAALPAGLLAQERGTITGRVTDQATGQAIAGAQVTVQGTGQRANSDAQGQFRITGVPAGRYTVSASFIGREGTTQQVTVTAGGTATANFTLGQAAIGLEGLVVTATGETQRRREVGNAVTNINVDQVELAAVNNMSQLLQGRAAGVSVVQSGGTTGTGARIRIRGSASVSLSNEPLLIIDGVRADNSPQSASIGVGGQTPSRLNDINPEDIENIEILRGPAASALYGTAAANGVIQITTKKGRSGRPRWNAYTEQGTILERNVYPVNYGRRGTLSNGSTTTRCNLDLVARRICTPTSDELLVFSPLEAADPFRDGSRQKYGLNVSGGSEAATYYLSGDFEEEQGIYEINNLDRVNLRANVNAQISPQFSVAVNTGYITSDLSLPQNDNNLLGVVSGALLGAAQDNERTRGFVLVAPQTIFEIENRQQLNRLTGSSTANWRPLPWLSFVGTAGLDLVNRFDTGTLGANIFPAIFSLDEGFRQANRVQTGNYTGTINSTATFDLTPDMVSTTSLGGQFIRETFQRTDAFGARLLPGTRSLRGTSARFSINEFNTDVRTIGGFAQQQLAWRDRLFLTGAIRGDDNSAFGTDFGFALYPSVSTSWVLSEEPFFPEVGFLNSLRFRAAYGESGLRPSFRDAETFFQPVSARVQGQDVPGFTVGGTGNTNLRPERSREVEVGFDAAFFDDRIGTEVTYYNKRSTDALVRRRLAPSLGLTQDRFENLGQVRNTGVEGALRARLLDTDRFEWQVNLTASRNTNELERLGEGIEPIIFGLGGASQRHQEGFPLGGYWQRTLQSFSDANGNGIIERSEVVVTDTAVFLGSPFPTRELNFSTNATLFGFVRVSGLVDHKGGYRLNNSNAFFRCASSFQNCREAFDPTADQFDQARYIAALLGARGQYIEDASFTKLRELALTFTVPETLSRRFRTDGLSLTLSGRNLATWTNYTGLDPELNTSGQENFSTAEFLTQPPVRYYTARVDVRF
jgi:TonB-linked SusC/RagA family outer membrane protein